MKERREWTMKNSSAVNASGYWYPLSEIGAPTDLQLDEQLPFKTMTFENLSGEPYDIILDPHPISSTKVWRLADGKSLSIKPDDNITFHNVIAQNKGALQTAIGELKVTVRNY